MDQTIASLESVLRCLTYHQKRLSKYPATQDKNLYLAAAAVTVAGAIAGAAAVVTELDGNFGALPLPRTAERTAARIFL